MCSAQCNAIHSGFQLCSVAHAIRNIFQRSRRPRNHLAPPTCDDLQLDYQQFLPSPTTVKQYNNDHLHSQNTHFIISSMIVSFTYIRMIQELEIIRYKQLHTYLHIIYIMKDLALFLFIVSTNMYTTLLYAFQNVIVVLTIYFL